MFINSHLLSEPRLYKFLCTQLNDIFNGTINLDLSAIQKIAYSSWHKRYPNHIDQVFHGHWQNLIQRKKQDGSLCHALLGQAARHHFDVNDQRRLAIRMDRFDSWQSWVSNQSGLPVISYQLQRMSKTFPNAFERRSWIKNILGYRCLVSPYNHMVEDYIEREGLNESHMHLNGTTTMEVLWHDALLHPQSVLHNLEEQYNKNMRVKLLYAANPEFSAPRDFYFLLKLSRRLRQFLIAYINDHEQLEFYQNAISQLLNPHFITPNTIHLNDNSHAGDNLSRTYGFDVERNFFGSEPYWTHISEIELHTSVLERLKHTQSEWIDTSYLLYILSMNCFQRILVQRDDQLGFDQFQKFADDGSREYFEKEYDVRFHQLHGPKINGKSDLLTLEGRFAPKKTQEKNVELISSILKGFLCYKEKKESILNYDDLNSLASKVLSHTRPNLRLVAHFIKQPWNIGDISEKNDLIYQEPHFHQLRETLQNNGQLLFELLEDYPLLRKLITGVDAAANEMETPPEVFSVLYRNCRRHGIQNFTYHVGEDFEHLLSGIRAIYEAIEFLDLQNGDRIGHATAIGIDPTLWLNKMPDSIFISQGQWLENLLFLRHMSLVSPSPDLSLSHIESLIHKITQDIFEEQININILQQFFISRNLSPDLVKNFLSGKQIYYVGWRMQEYMLISQVKRPVLELLEKRWFSWSVIKKYEQKIEIDIKSTPFKVLLDAQQFVQKIISQRQLVLETLPTSNVRISHYESIKEHHVFRWMQIPQRKVDGDHQMSISLGSDDPGIFVTDMRNEFYHLFSALVTTFGLSNSQALNEISKLNDNGRIYRFDGP
ncbi:hypothetical protein [Aeromonas dhakensis]|uniref:hypothetical protein n=1 Tax=Aeromonas dhakensis TaxID=196024 RepID=UPI003BA1B4D7